MYVCICLAVTEKKIHQLVSEGKNSVREVTGACGAGSDCGSCLAKLQKMLKDSQETTRVAAPDSSLCPATARG